jgi:hypothetical protein
LPNARPILPHQRAVIERAIRAGHPTDVAESVLDSLEESLRAFERTRRLIIERLKEIKWHVYRRVSHSERRGAGDQRAGWRDPRAQVFPGANALWAIRAGCFVRNLSRGGVLLKRGALVNSVADKPVEGSRDPRPGNLPWIATLGRGASRWQTNPPDSFPRGNRAD